MFAEDQGQSLVGRQIGSYQVLSLLGAGGMGEVYQAHDTKLGRKVAIKVLPPAFVHDPERLSRFQREAKLASSLNHPHIVTVYDVGEYEGRQYLVTEFIDGGTLKDWARTEKRTWRQVVELLTGVADGLAVAHQAGILHRDIKPQNILITKSGYAKLADFGLAKQAGGTAEDDTVLTLSAGQTQPGMLLGTVAYMSPEQASGQPLDARSDIFSFGVVLYEMLAGYRPFRGSTHLETLQLILHHPPQPLGKEIPPALQKVVEKALKKDPSDRYQSMREMVVDLRSVTQESVVSEVTTSSHSKRKQAAAAAMILLMVLAAGGLVFWRSRQRGGPARLEYTQLTNFADSATSPALSPDGRMLTFIRGDSTFFGPGQIYVKLLPDGEPVQLTKDNYVKMSPKFSPDGTRIGYSTGIGNSIAAPDSATMDTWIVPVLGGQPQRLLTNAEGLTWSPDGAGQLRVLFSEMTGRGFQMSIAASTESRTEQRNVYIPPEYGMAHRSYLSPDRRQVLVIEMGFNAWLPCRLVPYDGSSPGKTVGPAPAQCTDAAWSPDGKWMYFSADTGGGVHTWRQRFPDGTPEQVTFGVTEEEGIHFAPDGRSFVTSIGISQSTVWIHDSHGDRQVTSEGYSFWPSISPDGKKLYYLVRTGGPENFIKGGLWVADLDIGQRQRLLPDFQMQRYTISADGQRVVFVAVDEKGRSPVWLASLNGRTAPRLLTTIDSWDAYFGAPGEVVFEGEEKATAFIYRIKEDGSELQKMIPTPFLISLGVSPDGRWVPAQDSSAWGAMMLYPAGGGSPTRICEVCSPPQGTEPVPPGMSWTSDRKFVYLKFAASTYAIPLQPGQVLPPIPASGFTSKEAVAALPGARLVSEQEGVYPGPNPSVYAFMKVSTQRNIYRVPVP